MMSVHSSNAGSSTDDSLKGLEKPSSPGRGGSKMGGNGVASMPDEDLFARPTPGFDPLNNSFILEFYGEKGDEGPLGEDATEDSVNAIADAQIAELKRLREVNPEEEMKIREKIKQNNSGGWLEALRPQLVGQTTIPIEYFNRLNQENERVIGYVARMKASSEKILSDRDNRIKELQEKLTEAEDNELEEKLMECEKHKKKADDQIGDLEKQIKELQKKLTKAQGKDLKEKLEECEEHKKKADDQIKDLEKQIKESKEHEKQADIKVKKLEAFIARCTKYPKSDREKEFQILQSKVKFLEERLRESRRTSTNQRDRITMLEQSVHEGSLREAVLKQDLRGADSKLDRLSREISSLNGDIRNLERQLAVAEHEKEDLKAERTGVLASEKDEISDDASETNTENLKQDIIDCEKEKKKLERENAQLMVQLKAFGTTAGASNNVAQNFERLSTALAVQEARNRHLIEKNKVLEAQRYKWMSQIKDNQPEWWDQVEALSKSKRNIEVKLLALYERLGFTDANMDGTSIIDRMNGIIDTTTTGEEGGAGGKRRPVIPAIIRLAGELEAAIKTASMAQSKAADLQTQLTRARTNANADKKERLRELKVFDDEELARRVDERTQMYRIHRRQYLSNIFRAGEGLRAVANGITDAATKNALNKVYNDYLSISSLPDASKAAKEAAEEAKKKEAADKAAERKGGMW